jgi:hypothetical protein
MQPTWSVALKNKFFTISLVTAISLLILLTQIVPHFFVGVLLGKPGITLADPVLNSFSPKDWSVEIFVVLYSTVITSLILNFKKPNTILLGLQTYVTVNYLRLLTLYCFTLEAPPGIIPLNDPLINSFAYGQHVFLKDLFFSGHMASLSVLLFIEERKLFRLIFGGSLFVLALLLAWQRVHYTIDIIFAPLVTWLVLKSFKKLNGIFIPADLPTKSTN